MLGQRGHGSSLCFFRGTQKKGQMIIVYIVIVIILLLGILFYFSTKGSSQDRVSGIETGLDVSNNEVIEGVNSISSDLNNSNESEVLNETIVENDSLENETVENVSSPEDVDVVVPPQGLAGIYFIYFECLKNTFPKDCPNNNESFDSCVKGNELEYCQDTLKTNLTSAGYPAPDSLHQDFYKLDSDLKRSYHCVGGCSFDVGNVSYMGYDCMSECLF